MLRSPGIGATSRLLVVGFGALLAAIVVLSVLGYLRVEPSLVAVVGALAAFGGTLLAVRATRKVMRAERELMRETELAQVTLHSIGDGVITTDVANRVDYMNPVAEHYQAMMAAPGMGRQIPRPPRTRSFPRGQAVPGQPRVG